MTTTVFVALDGSARAEAALAPATALAVRTGAELVLLTARAPDSTDHATESYLDVLTAFSSETVPTRPLFLHDREPADAITLAAEAEDSLVCMTTHGRSGLAVTMLGSVAEVCVRRSPAPILLVGPHVDPDWQLDDAPVVVAGYDGSATARDAALAAGRLAGELGGKVSVVEVVRPSDVVNTGGFARKEFEQLEALVAELGAGIVPADYEIIDGFDPADALVAQLAHPQVSLLAVASHGRSGVSRIAVGSVTTRTVRHASSPVLVTGPRYVGGG
jgi:nucleotide-binding universal stress UspA family protein